MLSDVAERVAFESGRPVLVVPSAWQPCEYGHDVAIAWNDSRRGGPRHVRRHAVPCGGAQDPARYRERVAKRDARSNTIPAAEVAATLARHGFDVEVETVAGNGHAGQAILSRIAADGADLLVMGAYGHSRMREFVLGGATRDVLRKMTVPGPDVALVEPQTRNDA